MINVKHMPASDSNPPMTTQAWVISVQWLGGLTVYT